MRLGSTRSQLCSVLILAVAWCSFPASAQTIRLEITHAAASFDERSRQPIVTYRLAEASKQAFAELTEKNVGKKMELRVDGRIIFSPVIREPILGGSGQISGELTVERAKEIADLLSTAGAKVEAEIKSD
jgi:preprotein translocase subunit SecD